MGDEAVPELTGVAGGGLGDELRNYQGARIVAGGTRKAATEWRYVPVGGAEPPPLEVRSDWVAIFPSGEKEVKLASRPCAGVQ